jgi:hypothetical protein
MYARLWWSALFGGTLTLGLAKWWLRLERCRGLLANCIDWGKDQLL